MREADNGKSEIMAQFGSSIAASGERLDRAEFVQTVHAAVHPDAPLISLSDSPSDVAAKHLRYACHVHMCDTSTQSLCPSLSFSPHVCAHASQMIPL